jgi:hypothetical protein
MWHGPLGAWHTLGLRIGTPVIGEPLHLVPLR